MGLHNPLAPNLHNLFCGGESAWTVMEDMTKDFRNGPQVVTNTTPIFNVIQVPLVRSVVLVLDISGSMDVREKLMNQTSFHPLPLRITNNNEQQNGAHQRVHYYRQH